MRRRIRLTGRRQLPKSTVTAQMVEVGDDTIVTLVPKNHDVFAVFPNDARVSLKLFADKRIEILDFGTIGKLASSQKLKSKNFVAPSCQLRITDSGQKQKGLLLGSTDPWTLMAEDPQQEAASKGIVEFLADKTAPQTWKLEIREDDYPLVRVDERIPSASMWAKTDPTFVAIALPVIVSRVFEKILHEDFPDGMPWANDWLAWAETVAPGLLPLRNPDDHNEMSDAIERLVDSFCQRHELADTLLNEFKGTASND